MGWALITAVNEHKTEKCLTCLHRHTHITVQEQLPHAPLPYRTTTSLAFWWQVAEFGQLAMGFILALKNQHTPMHMSLDITQKEKTLMIFTKMLTVIILWGRVVKNFLKNFFWFIFIFQFFYNKYGLCELLKISP